MWVGIFLESEKLNNLYDILGVKKTADAIEIKKAYRSRAQKSHPDRGGDEDEFHQISVAYQILSDKEKRKRYDETGEVNKPPSIEAMAQEVLISLFNGVIEQGEFIGDIVKSLKKKIEAQQQAMQIEIPQRQEKIYKLQKLKNRIISRKGDNFFAMALDARIDKIKNEITNLTQSIAVGAAALDMLANYEDQRPEVADSQSYSQSMFNHLLRDPRSIGPFR